MSPLSPCPCPGSCVGDEGTRVSPCRDRSTDSTHLGWGWCQGFCSRPRHDPTLGWAQLWHQDLWDGPVPTPAWHCDGSQPGAGRGVPILTHPSPTHSHSQPSLELSPSWGTLSAQGAVVGCQGLFPCPGHSQGPGEPQLQPQRGHATPYPQCWFHPPLSN